MDFSLTPASKMIAKAARDFLQQCYEPVAHKLEEENDLLDDFLEKLGRARMLGMKVPKEFGGVNTTALNMILVDEELGRCASTAFWTVAINNGVAETIYHWGTEEQRKKFIPPLCDGSMYASLGFTEPGTGSDPTAIATTAIPDGDDYVLNGTKRFITNAGKKGCGVFFAKDETGRVTGFIVDKSSPGYSCSKPWSLMGLGGQELVDVFFRDVRVPKENILGEKGNGFAILTRAIASERLHQMAFMLGLGEACVEEAVKYSKQRIVRGKPMAAMQGFQWMIGEMYAAVEACKWWTYRIACKLDEGGDIQMDSSALKVFVVPTIQEVARKGLQVHGSYGYCKEYKMERLYRTIAHGGVAGSSLEINKTIAGSAMVR